jgi:hypothetical protein
VRGCPVIDDLERVVVADPVGCLKGGERREIGEGDVLVQVGAGGQKLGRRVVVSLDVEVPAKGSDVACLNGINFSKGFLYRRDSKASRGYAPRSIAHSLRTKHQRSIHSASLAQRKPMAPDLSSPGAINRYFPCSLSRYACGKYQLDPWGW